ncbi:MAG: DUF3263 domain-containing protein [Actinobacteria bacterium]|nr:MAG: DUF3263 domain-containing protein [Actinomycetota bacterium]TMK96555.1 MAG: DUF3263 domain-containing protein [Actinomycetota bacterium]
MGEPATSDERWQDILDFERSWWKGRVRKEPAVRARFGLSAARYHQLLNRLIDRPEALEYDPVLVQRLRRLRESRRRTRFARRLGLEG